MVMKAYITKSKTGLVQLWNNKPEWNEHGQCFMAWLTKGYVNEVPIDVTANHCFRKYVTFETSPKEIEIALEAPKICIKTNTAMVKINLEKFICSFLERTQYRHLEAEMQDALLLQGLKYKDGQIIEINKPFEIKAGQWYMCIKNFERSDGSCAYIQGHLYQGDGRGYLRNEQGSWFGHWENSGDKYFRPATEEEIPHKPKFKVNDFIVGMEDHKVFKVMKVLSNTYEITAIDDGSDFHMPHYTIDNNYRNWDITRDVKDGDVLSTNYEVFIYSHKKQMRPIAVAHCSVNSAWEFYLGGEYELTEEEDPVLPATKAQCNNLFELMEKAGYKWDAEQKELKKIQKPDLDNTNGTNTIKFEESKEELTEFEKEVKELIDLYKDAIDGHPATIEEIKSQSQALLSLARKQIAKEVPVDDMCERFLMSLNNRASLQDIYKKGILDTIEKIKGDKIL